MKKLTFILFFALLLSCEKEKCDGAKVAVTNVGENAIFVFVEGGTLEILPGKTETYQLPKDAYQVANRYTIKGSEELHTFVTVGQPCEIVEVSLP